MLKLLLIGPFPPPHGGVSVHVLILQSLLGQAEIPCRVVNISRRAPKSDKYLQTRGPLQFFVLLARYSLEGWSLHVHINGHNAKSWLVALAAGLAGVAAPGTILTIHSGMAPAYLDGSRPARLLAWAASRLYRNIIAVNSEIKNALCSLSAPEKRIEILPAFLPTTEVPAPLPDNFESWSNSHYPLISTVLFFRPEYGFDLLVQAMGELRRKHPQLGCVVMGDSESRPEGLQPHMLATGDLAHDSCLAIIARSDVFVRATLSDGDSISVREAIALGTSVVASDVVSRPVGTICFKAGDANDLVSKLNSLLSAEGHQPQIRTESASDGFHRLLELYSHE